MPAAVVEAEDAGRGEHVMVAAAQGQQHGPVSYTHLDVYKRQQLWLVSDGQRESGAVFSVNSNGWAETAVEMSRAAADYERFGITLSLIHI